MKRNYLLGCGFPAIARHTAKILRSSQATTIGWTLRTAPKTAKTRAMATRIRSFFIFEDLSPIVRSAVAAAALVRHGRDRAEGHQGHSASTRPTPELDRRCFIVHRGSTYEVPHRAAGPSAAKGYPLC